MEPNRLCRYNPYIVQVEEHLVSEPIAFCTGASNACPAKVVPLSLLRSLAISPWIFVKLVVLAKVNVVGVSVHEPFDGHAGCGTTFAFVVLLGKLIAAAPFPAAIAVEAEVALDVPLFGADLVSVDPLPTVTVTVDHDLFVFERRLKVPGIHPTFGPAICSCHSVTSLS
jgi:hypothetical protein